MRAPSLPPTPARLRAHVAVGLSVAALLLGGCKNYAVNLPFGLTVNFPGFTGEPIAEEQLQRRISLPTGFTINTYAAGIAAARMLLFTPAGDLLISVPRDNRIYLVERDTNRDGVADGVRVLLADLDAPHGMALQGGWLYIAEADRIDRVRFDDATGRTNGVPQAVVTGLPAGGNHWTRTIGIGPDGLLYVSIGSSCNVCLEKDPRRAAILRYTLDGGDEVLFASGLRNAVGFAWQPETGAMYATDNGRDLLGDDFPPCELNRVEPGAFYGWPFANGARVADPDVGTGHESDIARSLPPAHEFTAHTAPLGITFYTGTTFPERYRHAAFVALHGSWNRARKSGYEVVALFFSPDGTIREEPFATGFEHDDEVIGRPVDVATGPDGALYVSDDFAGAVYRIAYHSPASGHAARVPATNAQPVGAARSSASDRAAAHARGEALWRQNGCATCHSPTAVRESYRPLANLAAKYTVDSLVTFLRAPQPPMPLYALADAERRDLAIYLLATYP